ncbi:MAG: hypothetical protein H6617_10740 [Bdellovibrionaceae bacterium]|nr:hypothetical protein [Bdellovibrionales bacterium]MCB9255148.1 hypothetical protein [Pseudobdellovibrionaceae bacterium]
MKLSYVLSLFLVLSSAAFAQQGDIPTVEESLKELVSTSKYLMRNLSHTTKAYSDTARQLYRDAQEKGDTPYHPFLKELVVFENHEDGYTVFKWPHELSKAAIEIQQTYQRRKFLDARYVEQRLSNQFQQTVHPAYWQSLTTTYVWMEYVRRAYLYNNLVKEGSEYYTRLTKMLSTLHEQAQTLIGIMGRLRVQAPFSSDEPHFEQRYGRFFHAGNVINFAWKTPQPDLTHYFAPYLYPLLVPNESDIETLERLRSKHRDLYESKELTTFLEKLKKQAQEQQPQKTDGEARNLNPDPMKPPSSEEAFKKEPEYVEGNRPLQMQILRLQFQVSREGLTLDKELTEVLESFSAQVQKLVEKNPQLQKIVDECRVLINAKADDYDSKTLVEKLQGILSGPQGIRPGFPALKPLPPESEKPGSEEKREPRIG